MMAANNSLKSNRSMLSKRREKSALSGSYANIELKELPQATTKQLLEIKTRLKREHKQTTIKSIAIFLIIIFVTIVFVLLNT